MRMLIVLAVAAALGLATWLVLGGRDEPVTKAEIERVVAKRPRGKVQVVLCNEQFIPSQDPEREPPETWTCDTYLGPSRADAQNGPSYQVIVEGDHIASIRRVPVH